MQMRLDSFLAGQLDAADESLVENHVDGCPHCQRRLDELTMDSVHAPHLAAAGDHIEEPLTPRLRQSVAAAYSSELATCNGAEAADRTKPESRRSAEEWPSVPGYDVVSVLGRGGLGVVYRANDQRLKRPVALKIIRVQATPDERERLQREAEALATLRHPGVVQIYEIGENAGRPFLALEYVAGGSLSRFAAGKPQPPRASARVVATLAETIHMAHEHGLVHRDLKPANVLLQWDNESRLHDDLAYCRAKVTDFGLVKNMAIESGLTHSRDLLGTPNYMAPEQAGGDPDTVGPSCDIWALGAILYELLTGRPPFHGATAVDTLMLVRQSEPVPPCRLQPKLPRDLETICLKCLEKAPTQRYATALELAEDLHRFRDGISIQARPVSPAGRTWRWCQRNPAFAVLSGFAAMMLLALAIGGPIAAYRESALRTVATERAAQAESERVRAGQNLDLATLALEETLKQVYERIGVRPDTLRDFDQNAWEATIPYLEQLVAQEAITSDLRLRKARATRQLARSLSERGQRDRAAPLFQQAIDELTALAAADASITDIQRDIGVCHFEYGKCLVAQPKMSTEGEAQMRLAARHLETLVAANPNAAKYREDLANSVGALGERLMLDRSQWKEARTFLDRAAELRAELSAEFPKSKGYIFSELFSLLSAGMVRCEMGDHGKATDAFQRAWTIGKQLSVQNPGDAQALYLQASALDGMTIVATKTTRFDEAKRHAQEATSIHDRLVTAFPAALQYVRSAVQSHELYRRVFVVRQDWQAAIDQSNAGLAIIEKYLAAHPNDRTIKGDELVGRLRLGETQRKLARTAEAADQFRSVTTVGDPMIAKPGQADGRIVATVAEAHVALGELAATGGDASAAATGFERAIELLTAPEVTAAKIDNRPLLKRALQQWSEALTNLGRADEAQVAQSRAGQIIIQD